MSNRTQRRIPAGRPLARKLFALALLVPFGLAPVLGVVHLALVRHTTCPEHGELIEVAANSAATPVETGHGWESSETPVAADLHQHHHCEVVPQRLNPTARSVRPPVTLATAQSVATLVAAVVADPVRSVAVLRLAPKASPPV